jgi:hypothetical protein
MSVFVRLFRVSLVVCTLALVSWRTPLVHAATFTVDTVADDPAAKSCDDATLGDCSLRGAITASNEAPSDEGNTVIVPAGNYVLSEAGTCTYRRSDYPNPITSSQIPLCLTGKVTLQGEGADVVTIDGNQLGRVMFVGFESHVEVSGVTIRNGLSDRFFGTNPYGGGILNLGTLTLTEVTVSDNLLDAVATGAGGGGVYNDWGASLTVVRSLFTRNGTLFNQGGGAIVNYNGLLTVEDSVFAANNIATLGGAIWNNGGTATITGSAIVGNLAADGIGGGIANYGFGIDNTSYPGVMTIVNSTISGNTSGASGGGIYNHFNTTLNLRNVTITDNTGATSSGEAGGLYNFNDIKVFLRNTIIAGNHDANGTAPDCWALNTFTSGALTSEGYNLIGDTTNCVLIGDSTGNVTDVDAMLAPLSGSVAAPGLPTPAHVLLPGSPALEAGNPAAPGTGGTSCPAVDQRGFVRPQEGRCDIGAIEGRGGFALTSIVPQRAGNTGSATLSIFGSDIAPDATVELTRNGESAIVANPLTIAAGGDVAYATFALDGAALGTWSVRVTNPDEEPAVLADALTIEAGREPAVWIDVIGHLTPRPNHPTRYYLVVGNRGNIDALDVPVTLSVPFADVALRVSPPPLHAGQAPIDWSRVPVPLLPAVTTGGVTNASLLLP